jgi:hypothetical protein
MILLTAQAVVVLPCLVAAAAGYLWTLLRQVGAESGQPRDG